MKEQVILQVGRQRVAVGCWEGLQNFCENGERQDMIGEQKSNKVGQSRTTEDAFAPPGRAASGGLAEAPQTAALLDRVFESICRPLKVVLKLKV